MSNQYKGQVSSIWDDLSPGLEVKFSFVKQGTVVQDSKPLILQAKSRPL